MEKSALFDEIAELKGIIASLDEGKRQFVVLPPQPGNFVQIRKSQIKDVSDHLLALSSLEENKKSISAVYLCGNPGCGKSQLARQVGESLQKLEIYDFIMTLDASSVETFRDSMAVFGLKLGCSENVVMLRGGKVEDDLKRLCVLVKTKLQNNYDFWLIIVDNVRNLDCVDFCPRVIDTSWGTGQVIVTTQMSNSLEIIQYPEKTKAVHLECGMDEDDSVAMFIKITSIQPGDCRHTIIELCRYFDFQPLAIAFAGKEILLLKESNKEFNLARYVERTKKKPKKNLSKKSQIRSPTYPFTMLEATESCVNTMWENEEALGCAFHFLSYCDRYSPIPLDVIREALVLSDYDELEIASLDDCTLLIKRTTASDSPLADHVLTSVHQVTHKAFCSVAREKCESCKIDDGAECIRSAIEVLSDFYRCNLKNNFKLLAVRRSLWSHMKRLFELISSSSILDAKLCSTKMTSNFSLFESCCALVSNNFEFRVDVITKCIAWLEKIEPCDYNVLAHQTGNLSKLYSKIRNTAKAKETCLHALDLIKKSTSVDEKERGDLIVCLSNIMEEQGELEQSRDKQLEAIELFKRTANASEQLAYALLSHSATLHRLGEYEGSQTANQDAVDLYESHYEAKESPEISNLLNNFGWLLSSVGELGRGMQYLKKSYDMMVALQGSDYHGLAYPLINMGIIERLRGSVRLAIQHSNDAVKLFKVTFGEDNLEYAEANDYLGMCYFLQGNILMAEECHNRSLNVWGTAKYKANTKLSRLYDNIGHIKMYQESFEEAVTSYLRSMEIRDSILRKDSPEKACTHSFLAIAYARLGRDFDKALEHANTSINLRIGSCGALSPLVAYAYEARGDVYFSFKENLKAKSDFGRAQEIYNRSVEDYGREYFRNADCSRKLYTVAMHMNDRVNVKDGVLDHCRDVYMKCGFLRTNPSVIALVDLKPELSSYFRRIRISP